MVDPNLVSLLTSIGLAPESARLVAILPLVQVAWADGVVQPEERRLIMQVAEKRGLIDVGGAEILQSWLTEPPSRFVFSTGRKIVAGLLAARNSALPNLSGATPAEIVGWCEGVALAAGGYFGFGKLSAAEATAIAEIVEAMNVKDPKSWATIKADFE